MSEYEYAFWEACDEVRTQFTDEEWESRYGYVIMADGPFKPAWDAGMWKAKEVGFTYSDALLAKLDKLVPALDDPEADGFDDIMRQTIDLTKEIKKKA